MRNSIVSYTICTSSDPFQQFTLDLNWNGSKRVHFGERSQTGTDSGSAPVRIQQFQCKREAYLYPYWYGSVWIRSSVNGVLDPVYTGTDPNGSVPVWVQIGFPFTLELLDPYQCGSAIRTSLGSLSKVYPFGSVPVEVQCKLLERIRTGTDRIRDN